MPETCKVGDVHGCGNIDTEGCPDVIVNGSNIHCVSHAQSHCDIQVGGSPDTFSNGLAHARKGLDMCGPGCLCPVHPDTVESSGSSDTHTN